MPRPLLNRKTAKIDQINVLSAKPRQSSAKTVSKTEQMKMDRLLRKKRSKNYMEAMQKLDAGGHVHNKQQVDEIIGQLQEEFADVELQGILLGIISQCFLGDPYEVHTLDIAGSIIKHYKKGEVLPDGMEAARSLALRGGYSFVEVYTTCFRAVSGSGDVSVIAR